MENARLAALILMLCAIDYLKSFKYGLLAIDNPTFGVLKEKYRKDPQARYLRIIEIKRRRKNINPGGYYIKFLKKYLLPLNKKYNINELYKSLRCGLIHNYSDKIFKYDFIDNQEPKFGDRSSEHLKKFKRNGKNKVRFNVDVFYKDFVTVYEKFWNDVSNNKNLQINVHDIKSYVGFMTLIPD